MSSSQLKIAVIGAGPAGCLLARLLHLSSIPFTVFEADDGLNFRSQGGTLDLHTATGIAALKRAELYDEFLKHARFDGEAMAMADKSGFAWIRKGPGKEGSKWGRPEIDRSKLREMLATSLPDGTVHWGRRVQGVDTDGGLMFKDGTVDRSFDLIVGADGAWSRIRTAVSDTIPCYTGVMMYQGSIPNAKEMEPELYALVNRGNMFGLSDNKFISGQQMGDGSLFITAWSLSQEGGRARKIPLEEVPALKRRMKEIYHDWSPQLQDFILHTDDSTLQYLPLYTLPIGHTWKHRPGSTLIGDAAHLSPPSGEGVNIAMYDAMKLADAIINADITLKYLDRSKEKQAKERILSKNVRAFEDDLFVRARRCQQLSYDMMQIMFFSDASKVGNLQSFMLLALADSTPRLFYPLVAALVYGYFFCVKLWYRI